MEPFFFWIGFAVITAIAAHSRGRNPIGWFLLGCLFSFFALIAVLVMPRRTAANHGDKNVDTLVVPKTGLASKSDGTTQATVVSVDDRYSALERIADLKQRGHLTNHEFDLEKKKILEYELTKPTQIRSIKVSKLSSEDIATALNSKGYKTKSLGSRGWRIVEPLGGVKMCANNEELSQYASFVFQSKQSSSLSGTSSLKRLLLLVT